MMLPAAALAAQITDFGAGLTEAVAAPAPGAPGTVGLTVPAECHVRKVSLNITTAHYDPSSPKYPESVRVLFNDSVLYEFNGTGFGAFGRQEYFSDGSAGFPARFTAEGDGNSTSVRIPKRAVVENATFELECAGAPKLVELFNLTSGGGSTLGSSVAGAGDLDGDGNEDFILGDPYYSGGGYYMGKAVIYFGGQDLQNARVLNLTNGTQYSYFGSSVAAAGDVNGDGYGDVLVGAYGYTVGSTYFIGAAYLYFGGSPMDSVPDLEFYGGQYYGEFGYSVAGAGDLDGDGYDDILIGEPYNSSDGMYRGAAYVYFGGADMDAAPDLVFHGTDNNDYLGTCVAGAGDLNGDGRPDIVIGAIYSDLGGSSSGEARVYFGGPAMDNSTDLSLPGHGAGDGFGSAAAAAGDLNGDGSGDLIVGAYLNTSAGSYTGAAYVYFGGPSLDGVADVVLSGEKAMSYFGSSVAGGFDLNQDGYDDIAVGAPQDSTFAAYAGRACVYFGGPSVNLTADVNLSYKSAYAQMGESLAGARDLNGDGRSELLVGAPGYYGMSSGRLYVFGTVDGVLDPQLEVASRAVFGLRGYVNRTFSTPDLSAYLNGFVQAQVPSGKDGWGNFYCDVPVSVSGRSEGSITLRPLNLTYECSVALPDFTDAFNGWIGAHRAQADAQGNLRIPLAVESSTPGSVRFTDLDITIDEAPRLLQDVPDLSLDEDSYDNDLIDLGAFFEDDFDTGDQLSYSIVSASFSEIVALTIRNTRFLSVDALEGDQNDNWTGTVDVVVRAEDHWGSGRSSNTLKIRVQNVNDPPVITSEPPPGAQGDVEWVYRVLADDGDRDRLAFRLAVNPAGMAINGSTGVITWIPQKWGRYPVAVSVTDGTATAWQNFTLAVPNRLPVIASRPPPQAFIGQPFSYAVSASDPDNDALAYSLGTGLEGFSIDPGTGLVTGVPMVLGEHELVIGVSDGRAEVFQNLTINVVWPNRSPYITTSAVTAATEGLPYSCELRAYDSDRDQLEFSLESGPSWLSIESGSGRLYGTPELAGNSTVMVKVLDGRGGVGRQAFTLRVADSLPAAVTLDRPAGKARGSILLSGAIGRGTRDVLRVEVRLDGGAWREAAFGQSWNQTVDTGKLRDGEHTVEVRAYDGWEYSTTVSGVLEVDNSKSIRTGGIGPGTGLLIAGAVAAAAAAAVVFVLVRRRRPAHK